MDYIGYKQFGKKQKSMLFIFQQAHSPLHLGWFGCPSDPLTPPPAGALHYVAVLLAKPLSCLFLHLISGHSWMLIWCNLGGNICGRDVNPSLCHPPLTSSPSIYGSIFWSTGLLDRMFALCYSFFLFQCRNRTSCYRLGNKLLSVLFTHCGSVIPPTTNSSLRPPTHTPLMIHGCWAGATVWCWTGIGKILD